MTHSASWSPANTMASRTPSFMNTPPGPWLIEPGDRLPLAPCRLQGKLRRGRDPPIDGMSARPCIRQASRPVGDVPRSLEQARPTEERAARRLLASPVQTDGQERNQGAARKGRLRGPARKGRLES